MEFKDRIKTLRRKDGMTQSQLAAKLGKSEGAIRAWEIDRSKPDVDTLIKLTEIFDCTADYLLGLDDYRNEKVKNDSAALSSTLSETISKIPDGKDLFEDLIQFLEFTDMEGYESATFQLLKASKAFLLQFIEMQKIQDKFTQSKTFNLSLFIDFVTNISTVSAGTNRLMHVISTIPVKNLLKQAEDFGSLDDREIAMKIYSAYYERFIYDIPSMIRYDV